MRQAELVAVAVQGLLHLAGAEQQRGGQQQQKNFFDARRSLGSLRRRQFAPAEQHDADDARRCRRAAGRSARTPAPSSPQVMARPVLNESIGEKFFTRLMTVRMPLNTGIKTTSATECPATPVSSLPAADRAARHRFRQRAARQDHHQHGQRKKCRDRKRQKTRRRQPQRRQQRHPAKNDSQPAREIQREAAFGIQHLHAVLEREQQRGVVRRSRTRWSARPCRRTDSAGFEIRGTCPARGSSARCCQSSHFLRIADLPQRRQTCRTRFCAPC